MSDSFTRSICGEEHQGLVTDWGFTLPDVVWAIPEAERADQARFNTDGDIHRDYQELVLTAISWRPRSRVIASWMGAPGAA